ncbi:MAG: helix-turn-helix domain-containing protein [Chloroflexi bacterium]|jgi:excisionase family DNA binding protein|nr:helix-turn-helix domain-containing protein [Chloroflexota bacterium]
MTKSPLVQLLTIEDVAELFQVSAKTVRRWISAGDLPAAKLGNQWRIANSDAKCFFVERLSR